MANKYSLLITILLVLLCTGCKKEKETRTIVDITEEPKVSKEPKAMEENVTQNSIEWGSSVYQVTISRKADKESVVKDADGNRYYDNTVTLCVDGPSANIINRQFCKADFANYVNSNYIKPKRSALMGIGFDKIEGGNAIFVATVGSPDTMDDEFMTVKISLSKSGDVTLSRLQTIDAESDDSEESGEAAEG